MKEHLNELAIFGGIPAFAQKLYVGSPNIGSVNYANYKEYKKKLLNIPGVRLLTYDEGEVCNYQYIILEIDSDVTHINRDRSSWDRQKICR